MAKLSWLLRIVDRINDRVGVVVMLLVIVMALALLYEVVMRYAFNNPTVWAHELTQMIFGAYFMLGAGYAFLHKAHVTVDILHARLSLRKQAILDLVTSTFFFLFCVALVWKGGSVAWEALSLGKHSSTGWSPPIAPVTMTVPIGALLLLLQGAAKFIRDLITATGREQI